MEPGSASRGAPGFSDFFRLACRVAVRRFQSAEADVANADAFVRTMEKASAAGVGCELPYGFLLQIQLASCLSLVDPDLEITVDRPGLRRRVATMHRLDKRFSWKIMYFCGETETRFSKLIRVRSRNAVPNGKTKGKTFAPRARARRKANSKHAQKIRRAIAARLNSERIRQPEPEFRSKERVPETFFCAPADAQC